MKLITFPLLFSISFFVAGQSKTVNCGCPLSKFSGTKADTLFHLNGGVSIALCGAEDTDILKGKKLYSEFALALCGSKNIIKFWDALTFCNVKTSGDTLLVETIKDLPVGSSMAYKQSVWETERIYFKSGKLLLYSVINRHLPKYSLKQISAVLSLYRQLPNANNDTTIELADKLLISAISGSKIAEQHLVNFRQRFSSLDGVYLEEYDWIMNMRAAWRKQSASDEHH